jgi:hypothetical protein
MVGGIGGKVPPFPVPVEVFVHGGPSGLVWLTLGLPLGLRAPEVGVFVSVRRPLSIVVVIMVHSAGGLCVTSGGGGLFVTGTTVTGPAATELVP